MRRIQNSVIRLSILACLTVAGLAVNSAANAACTGTNTCYGIGALPKDNQTNNSAFGYNALFGNAGGDYDTAIGANALASNIGGTGNTAIGSDALKSNQSGSGNTATGSSALQANVIGFGNTATGSDALFFSVEGSGNTANGDHALFYNETGYNNTASGAYALEFAKGYRNVAFGWQAGSAVTGSDNIMIGAGTTGLAADNGVIRIGRSTYQKKAFIAGIRGIKTGSTNAIPVFIDVNGQLGTIKSSRRFKEDIQPMGSVSERLFGLRPVTFRYKQPNDDGSKPVQYGLIAEEVAQVFPELVVYGKDGKPETVSYHLLATLLLNEVQKDHRVMQAQAEQLTALRRDNETQAARMAALEQQVAVLAKAVGPVAKDRMVASAR